MIHVCVCFEKHIHTNSLEEKTMVIFTYAMCIIRIFKSELVIHHTHKAKKL